MTDMLRYESLHNHTTASDGTQSYAEVLATAERCGVGVVAFTDHDMLPSEADVAAFRAYTAGGGPVKWLVGCEISSGLPQELGGGATSSLHILGLFTDPTNVALREHCRRAQVARTERMERMVANLRGLGFVVSVEDCLAASGGETVGRPHIVRALTAHPENAEIIEGLRAQMQAEAVKSAAVAMEYARMLERPVSDYPYRLFLSEDAFISGVYVDYLYSIDLDAAVALIRGAGGVAVMAHWYTVERKIGPAMLEGLVREGRIDGVEIMGNPLNSAAQRAQSVLSGMAARTGCAATYGIDGHREQDIEHFVGDLELAGRTVGQTARLVARSRVATTWSSLG